MTALHQIEKNTLIFQTYRYANSKLKKFEFRNLNRVLPYYALPYVGNTMSYAKRQMEIFEYRQTKPEDWTWNGTIEATDEPCELCGCDRVRYAFPLISTQETGRQVLMVGSECVITYTDAEDRLKNELLGKAKRLHKKSAQLSKQAKITANDALRILLEYNDRIDLLDGKLVFWAYTGFLWGVIHDNRRTGGPRLFSYEISNTVAQMLLRKEVTPCETKYLRRLKRKIKRVREHEAEMMQEEIEHQAARKYLEEMDEGRSLR
jgi:hypothetical protein